MKRKRQRPWFESLRRDGALFAFVATLLLLTNAAAASHPQAEASTIICTVDGWVPAEAPSVNPQCPICLSLASCVKAMGGPGSQEGIAARYAPQADAGIPPQRAEPHEEKPPHGAADIRAPPAA